jgi:hypothetical protein
MYGSQGQGNDDGRVVFDVIREKPLFKKGGVADRLPWGSG